VKKLIDRLTGSAPTAPVDEADSAFFSTLFQDRGDEAQPLVSWSQRALDINARPYDAQRGTDLFIKLWQSDRQVVALQPAELARLAQQMQFVSVAQGHEVIGQDEQGDYMLVVLEGTVSVDRVQPWGARARLAEARAGDMLGEMSLLDAGGRFSACHTLTPAVLAVLDAKKLDELVATSPKLALALLASLARRLSLRLRQVSARLSALLSGG
jgi:CRP/FNR family cyclic AMP-dependent transcriptional regulator